jgi:23S rRNA pseudouridine2605 synthase
LNWKADSSLFPLRLQVFLAHAGIASRRASEALIGEGRITVNGTAVTQPGTKVQKTDTICLDGKPVLLEQRLHYLALNKPPEYLCSSKDPQGRPLALELLPKNISERLYNVGRLDYLSSGLVFFTNDGNFAARLSHPSSEIEKEYLVESTVPVPDNAVEEFLAGITIEGELFRALRIERLGKKSLKIVLIEGKNREIRKIFSHFHLHPSLLRRIRIGSVQLGDLPEGQSRVLSAKEIDSLTKRTGVIYKERRI